MVKTIERYIRIITMTETVTDQRLYDILRKHFPISSIKICRFDEAVLERGHP